MNNSIQKEISNNANFENWHYREIGSFIKEVKIKNNQAENLNVLAITKYNGLVDSLEYFKNRVFSNDLSNYKIIKKGEFAYSTIHLNEGAIGYLEKYNKALLSPLYKIFKIDSEYLNNYFLFSLLKTKKYVSLYNKLTEGSINRRASISFTRFSKIKIPVPPIREQNKIASILSTVDDLIENTSNLINSYSLLKKGLMQTLLTKGIGHTRFKKTEIGEIPEEWEIKTINDLCEILDFKRVPLNEEQRKKMKGDIPYYGANGIVDYINDYIFDEDLILLAEDGGHFDEYVERPIAYLISGKSWVNNHAHILKPLKHNDLYWIFYNLVHKDITFFIQGGTRAKLNQNSLRKIPIAYPKLIEERNKITSILLTIEKQIDFFKDKKGYLKILKKGLMQQLLTGKIRVKV